MIRFFIRYFFATVALIPVGQAARAQQAASDTAEIVMTREELTDLLTKVAAARKAQLNARSKDALYTRQFRMATPVETTSVPVASALPRDEYVYAELQRINSKLDLLLNASPVTSNTGGLAAGANDASVAETARLQQQISSLREELRVISRLSAINTSNTGYVKDIAALNSRIEDLTRQLNRSQRLGYSPPLVINQQPRNGAPLQASGTQGRDTVLAETMAIRAQVDSLSRQLKMLQAVNSGQPDSAGMNIDSLYRVIDAFNNSLREREAIQPPGEMNSEYVVYFDNNSALIKPEYYPGLERLAAQAKNSGENATLVIRGFTSTTGSALYNNRLSFSRAEAVKNWLIQQGVPNRNIAVYPHGADPVADDRSGRRVELSIRLN